MQRRIEIVPGLFLLRTFAENRPNERSRWTGWAGLNRAVPRLGGAFNGYNEFYYGTFVRLLGDLTAYDIREAYAAAARTMPSLCRAPPESSCEPVCFASAICSSAAARAPASSPARPKVPGPAQEKINGTGLS